MDHFIQINCVWHVVWRQSGPPQGILPECCPAGKSKRSCVMCHCIMGTPKRLYCPVTFVMSSRWICFSMARISGWQFTLNSFHLSILMSLIVPKNKWMASIVHVLSKPSHTFSDTSIFFSHGKVVTVISLRAGCGPSQCQHPVLCAKDVRRQVAEMVPGILATHSVHATGHQSTIPT